MLFHTARRQLTVLDEVGVISAPAYCADAEMTAYLASERAGEDAVFDRFDKASKYGRVVSPSNGSVR
jgi:hypothetical protein